MRPGTRPTVTARRASKRRDILRFAKLRTPRVSCGRVPHRLPSHQCYPATCASYPCACPAVECPTDCHRINAIPLLALLTLARLLLRSGLGTAKAAGLAATRWLRCHAPSSRRGRTGGRRCSHRRRAARVPAEVVLHCLLKLLHARLDAEEAGARLVGRRRQLLPDRIRVQPARPRHQPLPVR